MLTTTLTTTPQTSPRLLRAYTRLQNTGKLPSLRMKLWRALRITHKNLLFLIFLFSCIAIIASEEQDYQLIKKIKLNDVHTIKDLDTYVQEKPENKDLAFLAKAIMRKDVNTKIFEYLLDIKTETNPSIFQYDFLANVPPVKVEKTEYFLDEEKTTDKILVAIKNKMDWQTVGNTLRIIELYRCLQSKIDPVTSKKLYPEYTMEFNPNWLKNYKDNIKKERRAKLKKLFGVKN